MRSPVRAPVKSRGRVSEKSAFAVAPRGEVSAASSASSRVSETSSFPNDRSAYRRARSSRRCVQDRRALRLVPRAVLLGERLGLRRAPPPELGHHPHVPEVVQAGRRRRRARGGQLRRHLLLEVRNDRILGGVEQLRVVRLVAGQRERHLGDRLVRVLRQPGAPLSLEIGGGAAAARATAPPAARRADASTSSSRVFASSAARLRAASSFLSASLARGDAPGTPFADLLRMRGCGGDDRAEPLGVGGGGGGDVGGARRPRRSPRPPRGGHGRRLVLQLGDGRGGRDDGEAARSRGPSFPPVPSPLLSRVPKAAETERPLLLEGLLEGPPPPGGRASPPPPPARA